MEKFESSFKYKVIYIFEIQDEEHKGLLKIGDATLKTNEAIDNLKPNCKILNQAALERIKQYTNTVGVVPILLHTELAIKVCDKENQLLIKAFRDHDVHRVLENSNIHKVQIKGSTSREWFKVDLNTAVKAIDAVKKNQNNLSNSCRETQRPIIFRPEQQEAIDKTIKQFKDGSKMLWNAKMRFGKTLSALQVVKQMKFKKTIIITHRPVVDNGWYEDFNKIFNEEEGYIYGSKNSGYSVEQLEQSGKKYVYFASIQDLRGSDVVGGKYDKNNTVFKLNWDFVIVDEAHEGTTTALGDEVVKNIIKDDNGYDTKFLALSGTPFNILRDYDEKSIYTWDYIMEQSSKFNWDKEYFGDSNPYEELPELKIYTYDLGNIIGKNKYVDIEDKAFNFREFFRTWTGNVRLDEKELPQDVSIGDFYHEDDVRSFLNLITREDEVSNYPYSKKEYRDLFRHSLWMVPGVKEAKALSKMMKKHPVFGMGFEIINVAGEGDDDVKSEDALKMVRDAIKNAGDKGYTITLSCGKLTTGVTVPEWTSVLMLSGSFSTSAANYLQTIFRVQSPCNKDGKIKTSSYVFDFAPDRTLKMVAESVAISTRAGKTTIDDRKILGEFLNYCPVISIDGTKMKKYDTNRLLQQLKRAYAERAVQNGFDDTSIYNDELLKLDGVALEDFAALKGIIGTSKASHSTNEIDINSQGFTNEEYEEKERIERKPLKERTPEEQAKLDELKEKSKNKKDAISILRGISIRMPLLIYGADISIDEDVTIDKLTDLVDDSSWYEFMPKGVTKECFKKFIKYYDQEIFISAGRRIRNIVKVADELEPLERVKKISQLFSCFKNPDKETVLTPWRVVNMHLSDCLGGYSFYDKDFKNEIETPRFVDNGEVTKSIFNKENVKLLEINSKTGLYPLYLAYSVFASKCSLYKELTLEVKNKIWEDVIANNIFVICKTPMAKSITRRTLIGFKSIQTNAHYFDDLINMMENKPKQFIERVLKPNYWKNGGGEKMKFDAIIGNPPYQVMDGGASASAKPVYNLFIEQAIKLEPNYLSMIAPSRWYAGGKGLDSFRKQMLKDKRIMRLIDFEDARDCFQGVNIAGGIFYFLWNKKHNGDCIVENKIAGSTISTLKRPLDEYEFFVRNNLSLSIIKKVFSENVLTMVDLVKARNYFNVPTTVKGKKTNEEDDVETITSKGNVYLEREKLSDKDNILNKYKVIITYAMSGGNKPSSSGDYMVIPATMQVLKPGMACSETYLCVGDFENEIEARNLKTYMTTKFFRFLLLQALTSIHITKEKFCFIPQQNFSQTSDLQWDMGATELDKQLYNKYKLTQEEIDYIEEKIKRM